jgi:hypothetical protein
MSENDGWRPVHHWFSREAPDKEQCADTECHDPMHGRGAPSASLRYVFAQMHAHAAKGNSMRNVVPRPTSELKSIEPLCSCTIRNVLANPMPLPPGRVVKNN